MDNLHYKPAVALAALIRRKKVGCLELLDHFLARVDKYNPKLNAMVWMDREGARKRAKAADAALKKGKRFGPLHGVPMSIKESYQVAGSPTTWGAPSMKENVTQETAVAAQRMIDAGVTLFAKTNVPLMLADWQSYNAVYGVTGNPWDLSRTPGGSSGGSSAALAAGLTAIDAGSDIGSSIRNPAHYCGVYGHKPTYGLITYRGHSLPNSVAPPDISVVGPLARSAEDLDMALDIMAGPDPDDGGMWRVALPKCEKTSLKQFRIAVKLTDPESDVDANMPISFRGWWTGSPEPARKSRRRRPTSTRRACTMSLCGSCAPRLRGACRRPTSRTGNRHSPAEIPTRSSNARSTA
jgi:amidase